MRWGGEGVCVCLCVCERGSEMNSGMQIGFRKVPYDTFFQNLLSDFLKWSLFSALMKKRRSWECEASPRECIMPSEE